MNPRDHCVVAIDEDEAFTIIQRQVDRGSMLHQGLEARLQIFETYWNNAKIGFNPAKQTSK